MTHLAWATETSARSTRRVRALGVALSASIVLACGTTVSTAAEAAGPPPPIDELTAVDAVQAICEGRLASQALMQAYLERARARPDLNAFITLDEAHALRAARAADTSRSARGKCLPLDGLPIVVKDNIHVAGLRNTAGTPALKDFEPNADAPVVRKLRDAGAIVIGKTNMHELAFGISGYNMAFKTGESYGVRNAYDPTRMAGGSSSGNGAAIGARIAPAGIGTDTGGSVRIPCAFNGCAALRPTVGRYPQSGITPISHTRDTAGPMAVSMRDVELLDRVISGDAPVQPADPRSVRLGVVAPLYADLDDDTRTSMDAALAKLRAEGVTLVDVEMPQLMELNGRIGFPLALFEAHDDVAGYLKHYSTGVTLEQLAAQIASPDVKGTYENLVLPRKLPGPDGTTVDARPVYEAAMREARPALQKLYADTFAQHRLDGIVFPTVPAVAMPAGPESSSLENFVRYIRNTDPGSNAGVPGITLPVALGATTRLPVGLEVDGPAGSDRRLVAVGMTLEKVFGRLAPPGR
ncbi:MAG: indoleacetamide hydrolase [Burkholderiaceae bacterium]|nr:indoleacetamide hydrolase [Burkholderiaceae bacterium]